VTTCCRSAVSREQARRADRARARARREARPAWSSSATDLCAPARRHGGAGRRRRSRHLHGPITERQLIDLYAGALAVVFPPFDEDYGYVTLEAFLARKPVITTTDAGGPLEFVEDG
jgi:glycosyltransferase involved in cell wall biosynthesis